MANIGIKLTSKNIEQQLETILNSQTVRKQFAQSATQIVGEAINKAVDDVKEHFQPHKAPGADPDIIGKLGVGSDGVPDYDKLNNAWKLLQVGTKFAQLFVSSSKREFAQATYTIDIEGFYNAFDTNYVNPKSKIWAGIPIPWMKNFIEGMPTNQDYGYLPGDAPNSRTGEGVMAKRIRIPIETFELAPYGRHNTFDKIIEAIIKSLNSSSIKGKLNKALAEAIQ